MNYQQAVEYNGRVRTLTRVLKNTRGENIIEWKCGKNKNSDIGTVMASEWNEWVRGVPQKFRRASVLCACRPRPRSRQR